MARSRRKPAETFTAWSDLYAGGESEETKLGRKIIHSRNIIARGSEVSQADLDVSDEEWQHLIDTGSVRNYPLPSGYHDDDNNPTDAALGQSPVTFVQEALRAQIEEIEEGSAAMSAEDLLVRSAVVGTQIFGPSPEEVMLGVALPEGVEEIEPEEAES